MKRLGTDLLPLGCHGAGRALSAPDRRASSEAACKAWQHFRQEINRSGLLWHPSTTVPFPARSYCSGAPHHAAAGWVQCTAGVMCWSQKEGIGFTPDVSKASWWQVQPPSSMQSWDVAPPLPSQHSGSWCWVFPFAAFGEGARALVHPGQASQGMFMARLQSRKKASLCLQKENAGGHQLV